MSHTNQPRPTVGLLPLPGISEILGPFAISLEIFIRKDFGERYLTLTKFIVALLTLWAFRFMYQLTRWTVVSLSAPESFLFGTRRGFQLPTFMPLFVCGFIVLCTWHFLRIKQRNGRNEQWYSRSFGISHLDRLLPLFRWWERVPLIGTEVDNWFLYRFIEPGVFILLGSVLQIIDPILGTWLLISSVALLLKNNTIYAKEREWYLDEIDSQIRATYSAAVTQRKPVQETKGYSVVPVPMDEPSQGNSSSSISLENTLRETLGEQH